MPLRVLTRATHANIIDSFLHTVNAETVQEVCFTSGVSLAWCQTETGGMVQVRMNRDDAVQLCERLKEGRPLPFISGTLFPNVDTGEWQLSVFIQEDLRAAWLAWFIQSLRTTGHIDRDQELTAYVSFGLTYHKNP